MKLADQILICRGSTTYRANLNALSSIILFKGTTENFITTLDKLSASLESLTAYFDAYAYSKSEMRATFATKDVVSDLTENSQYVLTGDAKTETDRLLTVDDITAWRNNTLGGSLDRLNRGYEDAVNLVNADPIESDKIGEFSHTPRREDLSGSL